MTTLTSTTETTDFIDVTPQINIVDQDETTKLIERYQRWLIRSSNSSENTDSTNLCVSMRRFEKPNHFKPIEQHGYHGRPLCDITNTYHASDCGDWRYFDGGQYSTNQQFSSKVVSAY